MKDSGLSNCYWCLHDSQRCIKKLTYIPQLVAAIHPRQGDVYDGHWRPKLRAWCLRRFGIINWPKKGLLGFAGLPCCSLSWVLWINPPKNWGVIFLCCCFGMFQSTFLMQFLVAGLKATNPATHWYGLNWWDPTPHGHGSFCRHEM